MHSVISGGARGRVLAVALAAIGALLACSNAPESGSSCSVPDGGAASGSMCKGTCVDLEGDPNNCGTCGNKCPSEAQCSAGICRCSGTQSLSPGGRCCTTGFDNDTQNCGTCNNVCPVGATCAGEACQCAGDDTVCSGECVDTSSDAKNCGQCGNACISGEKCASGTCSCSGAVCNGVCVDTSADPSNCGACGQSCGDCPMGVACVAGRCVCPDGMTACAANPGTTTPNDPDGGLACQQACTNTNTDQLNCGGCGRNCNNEHSACDVNDLCGCENGVRRDLQCTGCNCNQTCH